MLRRWPKAFNISKIFSISLKKKKPADSWIKYSQFLRLRAQSEALFGWKVAQLGPLRDRHLSAFLCEGVSGDLSECQLFYGKGSQSQKKPAIQSHWKYNIEAFSWNVAIYSCHTTLSKWNHILCQTSKDIITWKLFLLPWCMVTSRLPQTLENLLWDCCWKTNTGSKVVFSISLRETFSYK